MSDDEKPCEKTKMFLLCIMVQNDLPDVISILGLDRISWTGIDLLWLQSGSIHLIVAFTFTSSHSSHSKSLQSPVPAHIYYKIGYMRISVRWTVKFLTLGQNFRFTLSSLRTFLILLNLKKVFYSNSSWFYPNYRIEWLYFNKLILKNQALSF